MTEQELARQVKEIMEQEKQTYEKSLTFKDKLKNLLNISFGGIPIIRDKK